MANPSQAAPSTSRFDRSMELIVAGTSATVNAVIGSVIHIAAGASPFILTNSYITPNSKVKAWIQQQHPDTTCTVITCVNQTVSGIAKFHLNAAPTANLTIAFEVNN